MMNLVMYALDARGQLFVSSPAVLVSSSKAAGSIRLILRRFPREDQHNPRTVQPEVPQDRLRDRMVTNLPDLCVDPRGTM